MYIEQGMFLNNLSILIERNQTAKLNLHFWIKFFLTDKIVVVFRPNIFKLRTAFWADDVEEFVWNRFNGRQIFSLNATLIIEVPTEDFAIGIVLAQLLTFCCSCICKAIIGLDINNFLMNPKAALRDRETTNCFKNSWFSV